MTLTATMKAPATQSGLLEEARVRRVANVLDAKSGVAIGPHAEALKHSEDYPILRYEDKTCVVMELVDLSGRGWEQWYVKSTHTEVAAAEADMGASDVLLILSD